jgi:hypothetical protein
MSNCTLMFEKRVLRKIFGPKREELTAGWKRLHSELLYDLYSSPNFDSSDKVKKNEKCG